jgi:hypothetical protein
MHTAGGSVPRNPRLPRRPPDRGPGCLSRFRIAHAAGHARPPGAELYPVPARKSCGHFRIAPPGDHPLVLVEVVIGRVPCRVARRVLKTQYRNGSQDDAIQAALPWRCAGPEGLIVCDKTARADHKAIRARFRE